MTAAATAERPQHLLALARANEVRLARAELKREVLAGGQQVADIVLDAPSAAENMTVADLLLSQRRWGQTRVRKLLASIPISETKTVGSMTDRQRRAVAAALGRRTAEPVAPRDGGRHRAPVLVA